MAVAAVLEAAPEVDIVVPVYNEERDLAASVRRLNAFLDSRLASSARVRRGPRRELISRAYNLILRLVLGVGFRDAQCGFKALRAPVARRLLPEIVNRNWFFDTELLVRAERSGLRIHEVPVDWVDDPDSRVDVVATSLEDLRGIWRLATSRPAGAPGLRRQVARFLAIGADSTVAYGIHYWVLI